MFDKGKTTTGVFVLGLGFLVASLFLIGVIPASPGKYWLAGAAGFGLLAGFVSGASEQAGTSLELTKLLGAGLIVPIIGGIGGLVDKTQTVIETMQYDGEQLIGKTTSTIITLEEGRMPPAEMMGGFLFVFCVGAMFGMFGGIKIRVGGTPLPFKR